MRMVKIRLGAPEAEFIRNNTGYYSDIINCYIPDNVLNMRNKQMFCICEYQGNDDTGNHYSNPVAVIDNNAALAISHYGEFAQKEDLTNLFTIMERINPDKIKVIVN